MHKYNPRTFVKSGGEIVREFNLDVVTIDGVETYSMNECEPLDRQSLVVESPTEGKFYRVQPMMVDDQPNLDLQQADVLVASDGRRWRVSIEIVDGVPTLAAPVAV